MKNRSRQDIIASMLKNSKEECSRSHLMHLAILTHRELLEYLGYLQRHKLIEIDEDTRHVHTTKKGNTWLTIYKELVAMTEEIGVKT